MRVSSEANLTGANFREANLANAVFSIYLPGSCIPLGGCPRTNVYATPN